MAYRLNLYSGAKLIGTEPVDVSLVKAKELALAALDSGRAQRAEVVSKTGAIVFQRWAVL